MFLPWANIVTTLSLASGFSSIVFSLAGHFTFAAWAILLSVFFDGIDGQIARLTHLESEFGKEYDSLVDVISFGVAPAILCYTYIYDVSHLWAAVVLFSYLLFSTLRLARYNVSSAQKPSGYFQGLPTTASGGLVASFILLYRKQIIGIEAGVMEMALVAAVVVLALLMISSLSYPNLDKLQRILSHKRYLKGILFFIFVALLALMRRLEFLIFVSLGLYLVCGPFLREKTI